MIEAFLKWLLYRFLLQCCTNFYPAEKNAPSCRDAVSNKSTLFHHLKYKIDIITIPHSYHFNNIIWCITVWLIQILSKKGKREPPLELIIQLAEFYQVSLDYLAGWTNDIHMQANAPIKNPSNLERQAIHIFHSLAPADQLLWLEQGKLLSKFHKQNNEQ